MDDDDLAAGVTGGDDYIFNIDDTKDPPENQLTEDSKDSENQDSSKSGLNRLIDFGLNVVRGSTYPPTVSPSTAAPSPSPTITPTDVPTLAPTVPITSSPTFKPSQSTNVSSLGLTTEEMSYIQAKEREVLRHRNITVDDAMDDVMFDDDDGVNDDLEAMEPPAEKVQGEKKGSLVCNGTAVDSEVIYWKVVPGDIEYESPITPHHAEHHDRYLTFSYDGGGW